MWIFRRKKESVLDEPIEKVLTEMNTYGPDSEEYPVLVEHLSALIRLRDEEKSKRRVSPDTMAIVIGNLVGILIIVGYEQGHVLASRATNMIIRPKETRTN